MSGCAPAATRHQVRLIVRAHSSRQALRVEQLLAPLEVDPDIKSIVRAIHSVESAARPLSRRVIEWTAQTALIATRRRHRLTVGPFQIRGGPWDLEVAVHKAVQSVAALDTHTSAAVAHLWNGPEAHRGGSQLLNYPQCIELAISLQHPRRPRGAPTCVHPECAHILWMEQHPMTAQAVGWATRRKSCSSTAAGLVEHLAGSEESVW